MHILIDAHWLAVALPIGVQFILFLRWLYRRIRNDELMRTFVRDMATNHLPHIYALLEKQCYQQGIETPPRPNIRWIDMNGRVH